jgi:16S rRNA processing protein RimM
MAGPSWSKSPTELPDGLLLAGRIGKPHGIAGEVYVVRMSDDPHRFDVGAALTREDGTELVIERTRVHRDRFLVKFAGVDTRTDAEGLRGTLYTAAGERRDLAENEFWVDDLRGLEARLEDGTTLGIVSEVLPGTVHDHLAVATSEGERLVPLVKEIVTRIDLAARVVVIAPIPGLFDPS